MRRLPHIARDSILFFAGLLGIANEALLHDAERPTLLVLFGAMCGLPAFLTMDERKKPPPTKPEDESP